MRTDNAIVYSELCRLCLEQKGVIDLFEKVDIIKQIYLCTGIQIIIAKHNWPRKICKKCWEIIRNSYDLRELATANEARLRVLFENEDDSDALYIDETQINDEIDCGNVTNTGSGAEDKNDTDEEHDNNLRLSTKRQRSSTSEHDAPTQAKKIAVRKDLYNSSKPLPPPGEEYTYTEGTKYGISKRFTVNSDSDIKISYTCGLCPKTFPSWRKVYCHQRSHNKNLPCTTCEKKFATKGDLEKHVRTHTGERPFICDICDKKFSQKSTLRVHKETIHQKENTKKKDKERNESIDTKESSDEEESFDQEDSIEQKESLEQKENIDQKESFDQIETLIVY